MVDLSTRYLGLDLASPIVASAGPLTRDLDVVRRLVDAGVGAIVMPSLFEEEVVYEQTQLHRGLEAGTDHYAESSGGYFPSFDAIIDPVDQYLHDLEGIRGAVEVPVIASLNASHPGSWTRYARRLEDAGADAVELNLYHLAADPTRSAADNEAQDLEVIGTVRSELDVPVAVKLSPYYSAFAHFAARVVDAGADGLVLFNRFYQPDLDLESLEVVPRVELSTPAELRLPLRWIAILSPQLPVSFALTSGIDRGTDVAKALMVGADVAMTTSALLRHGPGHLAVLEAELRTWLDEHEYDSVDQLRGSASRSGDVEAFERSNYVRTLRSWSSPMP